MKRYTRKFKEEKVQVKTNKFNELKTTLKEMLGSKYATISKLIEDVESGIMNPGLKHHGEQPDASEVNTDKHPLKRDEPAGEFERSPMHRKKPSGEHTV